ncbi:hypothetical protein [Aeromonas salmonicida]|uniref:hypothetical protein n=1 Tax=Aeromonas salmonicida TaxID=645 RepID=UPI00259F04AB|nr:hypothetical protein [Aeromonas salmonicida]MDM5128656.1 hypothetical protein [Aeromonas salmonicida]
MKMIDRFGLKPKKGTIKVEDETLEFFYKPMSYNLVYEVCNQFDEVIRTLLIIRHCLVESNGEPVFDPNVDLSVIGDVFEYHIISLMSTHIVNDSGLNKSIKDEIAGKPER